jgi:hypothetical protein
MRRTLGPARLLGQRGVGWKLWSHGRLALRGKRVKDVAGLKRMIARARQARRR